MLHGRQLVIGMHLDGEVLEGVDELEQEGEFVSGVAVHMLAHQLALIGLDQLGDGFAGQGAVGYHAHQAFHVGKFPAFANVFLGALDALVGGNFLATPHEGRQDRIKFQGIQHAFFFP